MDALPQGIPAAGGIGSYDACPAAEQVRAIDQALRIYFAADDWLRAKRSLELKRNG